MHVRRLLSACLLVGTSVAVVATPTAAHAAGHVTGGIRCTIVGTPGNDVLVGSKHRDVICGLGGNDRIRGRGGNDIIAGGPGEDAINGGRGSDRISGGSGNDTLHGAAGSDIIEGDSGQDQVDGDAGNDVENGGGGADVLRGGDGGDRITGARGDDDLGGGSGADDVDGGPGFNVCDEPGDPGDQQVRCVVDTLPPAATDLTATPATVDVSDSAQTIQLHAHVTDDTGVKSVQLGPSPASLVSGTVRDGIWTAPIRVPRYIAPGPRGITVTMTDRVGRWATADFSDAYTALDTNPDTQMPVLQSISLDRAAVDVRDASQSITATIDVTDDLAGPTDLYLCGAHAFPTGRFRQAGACQAMHQTSGDPTDSTWAATYVVPKGAPSGTWNFEVWISDASGNSDNDFWFGPDELAAIGPTNEPRYRAIPDGGGVFTVRGEDQDLNPPVLTSMRLSPSTVETSTGAVQVTADISGTDVEGITDAELFIAGYPGYPDQPDYADNVVLAWVQSFQLVSGTPQDGTWRATFVVPGGEPDGSYFIQATLQDSSHYESWVSPDSGWETDNHLLTPDLAPSGQLFVVANS